MTLFVGAEHHFHDPQFARDWADRFTPSPARLALFELMTQELAAAPLMAVAHGAGHVLEIGIGPGYLAQHVLNRLTGATYEGVDVSAAMLELSAGRLAPLRDRLRLTRADVLDDQWTERLAGPVAAVVSTWALHDLGGEAETASVYAACRSLLGSGGVLLNGDFVKPDGSPHDFEPGRFTVARHLELLAEAGFAETACLARFDEEFDTPTAAQNYAVLRAVAP